MHVLLYRVENTKNEVRSAKQGKTIMPVMGSGSFKIAIAGRRPLGGFRNGTKTPPSPRTWQTDGR